MIWKRFSMAAAIAMVLFCAVGIPLAIGGGEGDQGVPGRASGQAGTASSDIDPAQYYRFTVQNETVNVFVNYNGSLTIEYFITFSAASYSDPLRYFDIGFPTKDYDLNSMRADITLGSTTYPVPKASIQHGDPDYIDIGITIDLGYSLSIQPGNTGILHLVGNNGRMLYEDAENASMASFEFTPTWFDSTLAGSTISNYQVTFFFPANELDGTLLKWHEKPSPWKVPAYGLQNFTDPLEQRLYYRWTYATISQGSHLFGASFPKSWVDDGTVRPKPVDPAIVLGWWIGLIVFASITVLASILYLYAAHAKKKRTQYYPPVPKKPNPFSGCGCCALIVFLVIGFFMADMGGEFAGMILFGASIAIIVAAFGFIAYFIAKAIDKKRVAYVKPQLSIECVGVNKNLTVPEAAVIKNTPLGKVIFLVLFGMVRKGIIDFKSAKPILLEKKMQVYPENLKSLKEDSRKIRDYELDIYAAIDANGKLAEAKLKAALVAMIKAVHKKMVGFDMNATIKYHDSLMVKAWNQVKAAPGSIDFEKIADEFEYMVLDEDFGNKSKDVFANRTVVMPYWYYNPYRHWHLPGTSGGIGAVPSGFSTGGAGSFNGIDFVNSIASGLENVSSNIATNVSNFFDSIVNAVSPPPPAGSGSGGRSGGRSYSGGSCHCACACACAGCACACAGGGR